MPIKKTALLFLLLIYLSGTFTLSRFNLGISFEVRHIILVAFLLIVLMGLKRENGLADKRLDRKKSFFLMVLLLYMICMTISLFYTPYQYQALEKYMKLLFLMFLILGTLFMAGEFKPKIFFNFVSNFFIIVGLVYAIPVFMDVISGAQRGDTGLSGPNVTTRIFFFATCASLYRYSLTKRVVFQLASLFFIASIVLVGSRGGLVGAVLILVMYFLIKEVFVPWRIKTPRLTYKKVFLFPLIIAVLAFLYEPVKKVFMDRIIGVTFGGNEVYTSGRDIIYAEAMSMIKEKPLFGHGIDSFTLYTGRVYPHNLLLEMMVEIGLLGAIFFLIFAIYAVFLMFKMKKSPLFILSGIPLYMLIVQMFSGEFYDFRYFFFWIVPLLHYGAVDKLELGAVEKIKVKKKKRKRYRIVWS